MILRPFGARLSFWLCPVVSPPANISCASGAKAHLTTWIPIRFQKLQLPFCFTVKVFPAIVIVPLRPRASRKQPFMRLNRPLNQSHFCFTLMAFPPTVIIPARPLPVVLAATEKLTVPLPIPMPDEVMVIHPALLVACHAHRSSHETVRLADPPPRKKPATRAQPYKDNYHQSHHPV